MKDSLRLLKKIRDLDPKSQVDVMTTIAHVMTTIATVLLAVATVFLAGVTWWTTVKSQQKDELLSQAVANLQTIAKAQNGALKPIGTMAGAAELGTRELQESILKGISLKAAAVGPSQSELVSLTDWKADLNLRQAQGISVILESSLGGSPIYFDLVVSFPETQCRLVRKGISVQPRGSRHIYFDIRSGCERYEQVLSNEVGIEIALEEVSYGKPGKSG